MRMKLLKLDISKPRKESSLEKNLKKKKTNNTSNDNFHCVDKYCKNEFSTF